MISKPYSALTGAAPDVHFKYVFEKSVVNAPDIILPGHLWAGAGHGSRKSLFDPADIDEERGTFSCVLDHPEYFADVAEYLREIRAANPEENAEITIHTGFLPNLDVSFSIGLIKAVVGYLWKMSDPGCAKESGSASDPGCAKQSVSASDPEDGKDSIRTAEETAARTISAFLESDYTRQVLDKLEEYIATINAGLNKRLSALTLYAYYCKIGEPVSSAAGEKGSEKKEPDKKEPEKKEPDKKEPEKKELPQTEEDDRERTRERSLLYVQAGGILFEKVVQALKNNISVDLYFQTVDDYIKDFSDLECDAEIRACLHEFWTNYEKDKEEGVVKIDNVDLWNKNKNVFEPVKAAIWHKLSRSEDGYALAREVDGCLLTVYPNRIREYGKNGEETTNVVISLNPEIEASKQYTLCPLAEMLEQCEQNAEKEVFDRTGYWKRDHSGQRKEKNTGWPGKLPFSMTRDPWYLKPKEDFLIVPAKGTLLPYELILSAVQNRSSMMKEVFFRRFDAVGDKIDDVQDEQYGGPMSLGGLYKYTDQKLQEMNKEREAQEAQKDQEDQKEQKKQKTRIPRHLFALVKIHSSMLEFSNELLKSICLNMAGKAYTDDRLCRDNFLILDYRTCLYSDPTLTVLVTTDDLSQTWKNHLAGGDIGEAPICTDIKKLLEQREELYLICDEMSKVGKNKKDRDNQSAKLNRQLVAVNTRIQTDSNIIDPMRQEVYEFLQGCFKIRELGENVSSSAKLLIEDAEQESDKKTQAILGIFALLGLASAFVDCFDFVHKMFNEFCAPGTPEFVVEIICLLVILVIGVLTFWVSVKAIINAFFRKDP